MPKKKTKAKSTRESLPDISPKERKAILELLSRLVPTLAKCEHEQTPIFSLLRCIYMVGFGSGAVTARKRYTRWKPPTTACTPQEIVEDMVENFFAVMSMLHQPQTPSKMQN